MRRRLVAAFVGLAVVVVVAFGLFRAFVIFERVEAQEQALLDRSADAAQLLTEDALEDGEPVTAEMLTGLLSEEQRLEYRPADGAAVVVPAGAPTPEDALTTERTLEDGSALTLSVSPREFRDEIMDVLLPLLLTSLGLIVFAGIAGWLLARRLARPFTELAGVAADFGRGRLDTTVPRYGMPEADAIARALEGSAHSLQRMLRREREVSDYASHDLRTPITALRLTLEDLSLWPVTPPEVAQELTRIVGEVDRFSAAVSSLVDAPAPEEDAAEAAELVDVAALVREVVRERTGGGAAPSVRVAGGPPALVRVQPGLVRRAVELLLEHAAATSAGRQVTTGVEDGNGYVTVRVQGVPDHSTSARGVVWDQAVGVAGELGGRLTAASSPDGAGGWSLTLPKGHAPGAEDGQ